MLTKARKWKRGNSGVLTARKTEPASARPSSEQSNQGEAHPLIETESVKKLLLRVLDGWRNGIEGRYGHEAPPIELEEASAKYFVD
jgi:hypothetical protein